MNSGLWLPGVLEGWRAWHMRGDRLHSLSFATPWPPYEALEAHRAPTQERQCGIYAFKDREILLHSRLVMVSTMLGRMCVIGIVTLWGSVVEHEIGYRAQFGYPKELYVAPTNASLVERIAATYGVECSVDANAFAEMTGSSE